MSQQRVALFGGSFNPPHLGHVYAAAHARFVGLVDEVWVLPVAKHPYSKELADWDLRWAMCQAAFADLPFVHLHDDELRNSSGYTFDLVAMLMDSYPHDFLLVGGTDTQEDLRNWYRGDELAERISIHPVPRSGYDEQNPAALPALSSTLIRNTCAHGDSIHGLVHSRVAEIIMSTSVYSTNPSS